MAVFKKFDFLLVFLLLATGSDCLVSAVHASSTASCSVSSQDSAVVLSIDQSSGNISSLTSLGNEFEVGGGGGLSALLLHSVSVSCSEESVLVTKLYAGQNPQAWVEFQELYGSSATSVSYVVTIHVLNTTANFTVPVFAQLEFSESTTLKLWAPWDRESYFHSIPIVDPLNPSDGHFGWWDGMYKYGTSYGDSPPGDMIVAPQATVLNNMTGSGVSLIFSPRDTFLEMYFQTFGTQPDDSAGFVFVREQFRFYPGAEHVFNGDFVGHVDCWRPSLMWSVSQYPTFWEPNNTDVRSMEGLGSYSSYLGNLTDPMFKAMDYSVNWDLSGRFFPYMGMFLPPVLPGEAWLNDPEGSQVRANVSFGSIQEYYSSIQAEGFNSLSYFNVFEYGLNIVCPSDLKPLSNGSWQDSNSYLRAYLYDAWLNNSWYETPQTGCIYTWQNGIVLNPASENYHQFLLDQLARHIDNIPSFQGIVIDRSDWNTHYDLNRDDGVSWVNGQKAYSMKQAYRSITDDLRSLMDASNRSLVMMINTIGYSCLSFMEPFDGTFSEGYAMSALGLLGVTSPAILWTYDSSECCSTTETANQYFQWLLYLGVYPMAPFPDADHSITPDSIGVPWYEGYGPLFRALHGKVWNLNPHPIVVVSGSPKANAFVIDESVYLYPVVLGNGTEAVTLQLSGLPEAKTLSFQVTYPFGEGVWHPLTNVSYSQGNAIVSYNLQSGASLLMVS